MRSTILSKSRVLVAAAMSVLLVFVLCLSGCSSATTTSFSAKSAQNSAQKSSSSSSSSSASSSSSSASDSSSNSSASDSSDALQNADKLAEDAKKTNAAETPKKREALIEETTTATEGTQQSEQTEEATKQQTRSPGDFLPSLPHVSRFQRNSGYALMIPKSDAVRVYVYGTSQQEFNDYAQSCIESGFDRISSRGTGYLNASNAEGYRLKLLLDDTDVMFVRIEAPAA